MGQGRPSLSLNFKRPRAFAGALNRLAGRCISRSRIFLIDEPLKGNRMES